MGGGRRRRGGAVCCCARDNYDPIFHDPEKVAEQLTPRKSVCRLRYSYFHVPFYKTQLLNFMRLVTATRQPSSSGADLQSKNCAGTGTVTWKKAASSNPWSIVVDICHHGEVLGKCHLSGQSKSHKSKLDCRHSRLSLARTQIVCAFDFFPYHLFPVPASATYIENEDTLTGQGTFHKGRDISLRALLAVPGDRSCAM